MVVKTHAGISPVIRASRVTCSVFMHHMTPAQECTQCLRSVLMWADVVAAAIVAAGLVVCLVC